MSYARWTDDSDVYVFGSCTSHKLECCWCSLCRDDEEDFSSSTYSGMLVHLNHHLIAGHMVPEYAFATLASEQANRGDDYETWSRVICNEETKP